MVTMRFCMQARTIHCKEQEVVTSVVFDCEAIHELSQQS